jgi:hypothetical protein
MEHLLELANVSEYLYRCITPYLPERTVEYNREGISLERGCTQGSVLGPSLWNIQLTFPIPAHPPPYMRTISLSFSELTLLKS